VSDNDYPKYRTLINLKGCSFIYHDEKPKKFSDLWNDYYYRNDVHPEDLDIEHVETYEMDENLDEVRKVDINLGSSLNPK
tara:strand:- start:14279 stop:14518 length:240 start_codon:yes stop_codon:yes gene_type:complete